MKSKLYKQYRFIDGKFITMNNCSYGFHIDETDSFYDQMREPLKKGKFDGLTYIHIDKITIEDKQDIFFEEKSFTLNAILLDVDDKGEATSVLILIKKVRLICDEYSKKNRQNDEISLSCCRLEVPYNTKIEQLEFAEP